MKTHLASGNNIKCTGVTGKKSSHHEIAFIALILSKPESVKKKTDVKISDFQINLVLRNSHKALFCCRESSI